MFTKFRVRKHEVGLWFRHGDFKQVLQPGAYWIPSLSLDPKHSRVEIFNRLEPRFEHKLFGVLLEQPRRLIISILCGNELVNIAASVNMAGILVALYGPERGGVVNVLVMVPLLLLLGEVTPKTVAVANPVGVSTRLVASPMSVWVAGSMGSSGSKSDG